MAQWQLRHLGETTGPYSWEELRFLAARRKIAVGDEVSSDGVWTPVENVSGLLSTSVNAPPAPAIAPTPVIKSKTPDKPPAAAPLVQPPPSLPPRMPPSLPADRRTRRPIYLALGAALAVLLLLMFCLFALQSGGGAGSDGDGSGADSGGQVAGVSAQGNTDGAGGSTTGPAAGAESDAASDAPALATDDAAPPDAGGSGEDAADEPPAPEGVPEGDPEGQSTEAGDSSEHLPPSAAVIRALDDNAARANGSGAASGAAGGSAEFFQIRGKGRRFVYVVDCSGSMMGAPFEKARAELLRSIDALASGQSFFVIFFDNYEHPQPGGKFVKATASHKRGRDWVAAFELPGGGTQPEAALLRALRLKPDAIFLLTDGAFDPAIAASVRRANKKHTAIHTISFVTRAAEPLLKLIASENGGDYRFVP